MQIGYVAKIVADVLLKTLTETPETPDIKKDYINIILASSIRFVSLFIHYMIINPDKNNVEDELLKELTLMFIEFFLFYVKPCSYKRIESEWNNVLTLDLNQAIIDPDRWKLTYHITHKNVKFLNYDTLINMKAIIIIDHGSRYPAANDALFDVADLMRKKCPILLLKLLIWN